MVAKIQLKAVIVFNGKHGKIGTVYCVMYTVYS